MIGSGIIPVIAPIGFGPNGETFNVNADTAAGAIAAAVGARRLLLLTDVAGVLDGDGKLIHKLTTAEAGALIDSGVAKGGMIPKLKTAMDAVEGGAGGAVILDGRAPHGMLAELFTAQGAGTLVTK